MGWRFRRSIKLLPGVRLNVGKRGFTSVSVGGRGFTTNIGGRGVKHTVGVPGTGLSFSSGRSKFQSTPASAGPLAAPVVPDLDLRRFDIEEAQLGSSAGVARRIALIVGAVGLVAALVASSALPDDFAAFLGALSVLALVIGLLLPSRARLEAQERQRCQGLAQQVLESRLTEFRAALNQENTPDAIRRIRQVQRELTLTDDEIGAPTVEALTAAADLHDYQAAIAASGGLLAISGQERFVGVDACFFTSAAVYDKRGNNDPSGTLFFTSDEALFYAPSGRTAIPWNKVAITERRNRTLSLQRRDRQTPTLFDLPTLSEALRAEFIVARLHAGNILTPSTTTAVEGVSRVEAPAVPATTEVGTCVELPGDGGFSVAVVGESYRQHALKAFGGAQRRLGEQVFFTAAFVPEPDNAYDKNAVKVFIHGGAHVGYLSAEDAARYLSVTQALGSRNAIGLCRARLIGGVDGKPSIGVVLDLADVSVVLNTIAPTQQAF